MKPSRLGSVDALRGAVVALMALDHTRDFFGHFPMRPTDLARTTAGLFFTRWVTHFCAPVFVLLAGVAAALQAPRMASRAELSRHLLLRGLWLVLLELTLVRLGWDLRPWRPWAMLQVIWALGWSMVCLAGLVWLPRRAVALFGAALVLGHNALDRWDPHTAWWTVLHVQRALHPTPRFTLFVAYPLIPWLGVMALGYALGPWFLEPERLERRLLALGSALTAGFLLLRGLNVYGDPSPWSAQPRAGFTVLSFLNCTKYPPSLAYLLMTLGPALLLLAALGRAQGAWRKPLETLGRAPLFFYLVHLPALQLGAGLVLLARVGPGGFVNALSHDGGPNFGLAGVYLAWLTALALLYALCVRYDARKRSRPSAWMKWV